MTLAVTERAAEWLRFLLDRQSEGPDQVLRLSSDGQGSLMLRPDESRAGDQIVQHRGDTVMVLEPSVSEFLDGKTLDLREDGLGFRLSGYKA